MPLGLAAGRRGGLTSAAPQGLTRSVCVVELTLQFPAFGACDRPNLIACDAHAVDWALRTKQVQKLYPEK